MTGGLAARFGESLRLLLAPAGFTPPNHRGAFPDEQLGLAVSGGGDSMAMLHLAVEAGLRVQAVTVDHGLRPEAAAEAAEVGRICAALGVPHQVLRWQWDGNGNLQDAARRGRRTLIAEWARSRGLATVALAHTEDDVAETFLMRLVRGAGVDGLSAMAARWQEHGVTFLRPLLAVSRADLRDYLGAGGHRWIDDPSNDNTRFDRVRARKALAALAPLGLGPARLAEVAGHLAEARAALEVATDAAWDRAVSDLGLALELDLPALAAEPVEIRRRLLVAVIRRVAPADYAPRGAAVQGLLARLQAGRDGMLAGCRFQRVKGRLWAYREARAVAGLTARPDQPWDGRWHFAGPISDGAEVRALGAGLSLCPDWRATGFPRGALLAAPALWQEGELIAAPHAGFGPGYSVNPLFSAAALHQSTHSH